MPVKFYLDPRPNRQGECPIRASFCCKGTKWTTSTGFSVSPGAWLGAGQTLVTGQPLGAGQAPGEHQVPVENPAPGEHQGHSYLAAGYVNSKGQQAKEISARLTRLQEGIERWERTTRIRPTTDQLQKKVKKLLERNSGDTAEALHLIDEFIGQQQGRWSAGTSLSFKTFRGHIAGYDPQARLDDFDGAGIERWLAYLRSTGMEESTLHKEWEHLRWFLSWAERNGYPGCVVPYRPKFKLAGKPVIFLSKKELLRLWKLPLNPGSLLAAARDCFCFCALTSLRFSDMSQIKWADIEGHVLYVTTQKTFDRLAIDLCPQALDIIGRYPRGSFPNDLIFPRLGNRKMNECLKELGKMCRIDTPVTRVCYRGGRRISSVVPKYELLGTHAARRTFICFALANGVPPHVVMKWTGHSDYRSMKPYIDVTASTRAAAMKRISNAWGDLNT